MRLQTLESTGPATLFENKKDFVYKSSALPFGQDVALSTLSGSTYLTAQTLVQQVAYGLSDKLFTYCPPSFDLDIAAKSWSAAQEKNAHGQVTDVQALETRNGAGAMALGYMFSPDFDLEKRHVPQSIIASAGSLEYLRPCLDQLSLLYDVANPTNLQVAAVDYAPETETVLVTDYCSTLALADELGMGLLTSKEAGEVQHMSLLSMLMSSVLPSIHAYDGITVGRETTRINDILGVLELKESHEAVLNNVKDELSSKLLTNEGKLSKLLQAFNAQLGTEYKCFEYHGHVTPTRVLVVFGTVEASLSAAIANDLAAKGIKVGVINVRIYRPFVEEDFLSALPATVEHITVLGQVKDQADVLDANVSSNIYADVLAAVNFQSLASGREPSIADAKYARETFWTVAKMAALLKPAGTMEEASAEYVPSTRARKPSPELQQALRERDAALEEVRLLKEKLAMVQRVLSGGVGDVPATPPAPSAPLPAKTEDSKLYIFWDLDVNETANAPAMLGQLLSDDRELNVSVRSGHDNLVQGGAVKTELQCSPTNSEAWNGVKHADVTILGDEKLLKDFDVLLSLKESGTLLVKSPGWKDEDVEKKLGASVRKTIAAKNLKLVVLDPKASGKATEEPHLETYLLQLAFLKLARPDAYESGLQKLNEADDTLRTLANDLETALTYFDIPKSWLTIEPEENGNLPPPEDLNINSFVRFDNAEEDPPSLLRSWVAAAKGLAFKEAYDTSIALRPDLSVKTAVVRVKEHRRLTPLTYDRNIFHIEFDLGDSGLKYDIGEALGIHAENDAAEVENFIEWYGLDPDEIVEVPSRDNSAVLENRTVYQALMQNVDIFGRPPKRFYEALSEFATEEKEKNELYVLGTGGNQEAVVEFKRRAEVDTITYADLLLEFPSAHPSFHDVVRIVNPMKRREYSIASSQKVTPNSISLLIVTVNWVDPNGRDRFGQATRYLNALPVGAPVTVSVKPSVMKLPPKTTQPIIMAGLGTGLAPFRAFVQERAWQREQGMPIGDVFLYMGSRHQKEEYLYGEEWEAYQDAGIITLLGRAFSRDQPQKIYIQDRMRQTLSDIRRAYLREEGAFYLCGPTWPVPDVTNVLEEAVQVEAASEGKKKDGHKEIERLKEELRYVLEVY